MGLPLSGSTWGRPTRSSPRSMTSGSVVVLPNASGAEITPSVVYFEPDGSVVVGEEACRPAQSTRTTASS